MSSAQQTYAMLEKTSLWETAVECHRLLEAAGIPHVIVGGMAVCLHGYQRNTVDVDLLVRREDTERIKSLLEMAQFEFDEKQVEFRAPAGIPVQFLLAGERAGKGSDVLLPDPAASNVVTTIEGLPVMSLAKLIEAKLACGEGNLRRTYKDFADVVELIAARRLNKAFARHLHKSLRPAFRELVARARSTE